ATEEFVSEEAAPPTRRPPTIRAPGPSLSEEVERILRTSSPPRRASDPAQAAVRAPESSRARASLAPPRAPTLSQPELEDALPESSTFPRREARTGATARKKPDGTDVG
ncbi:MAG TPA: hypothetical protein VGM44_11105, partial [Polyangiaceae bacterium]